MLYQIYETQRSFMEPFADYALATSKLYSNPHLPLQKTPFAQRMSASFDLMYRLAKDYEKPEFGITAVDVDGVEVAIHERVELRKPFCELRRFKRFSDDPATLSELKTQPVVLIVAPLSGHYATLLRDTVRSMLQGHKVYITDWTNARLVPLSEGAFHLDDYVNYVEDFIRHLQSKYGNCHVMSVCQPTVPTLAAVSLMASRGEKVPLSMTMMGGPIDARSSPTAVNDLAVKRSYEWFENNVIYRVPSSFPGKGRRVYPGFLQHTGFVAMNPNRHAGNHYDYFKNLVKGDDTSTDAHRAFYDEYNAVLDMDADYYLETIETVFQKYKLVNGTWDVRAPDGTLERVRPQDIRAGALLTVEGELDDISGCGQTQAAHTLCSGLPGNEQRHMEIKGAGHYGIFSGRRWRESVYPKVRDFIAEHQRAANAESTQVAKPSVSAKTVVRAAVGIQIEPESPKVAKVAKKLIATRATKPAPAPAASVAKPVSAKAKPAKVAAPAKRAPKADTLAAAATKNVVAANVRTAAAARPAAPPANGPATRWVGTPTQPTGAAAPAAQPEVQEKATAVTAAPPPTVARPASRNKA
ncbi:MAG: polyhydroxyalkanoate depolymerase [Simplicispira suum]|uniref:polyhydroxyalkanoate depolymerase n=1 Tax=Simplicispira suum TaxID=2109915 RepID=UPI001C6B5FC7|nr:polyhydroxyalkanoate depolymerase [Simplicispira suum]MBW7833514.1 polyhydroxyalkanoate depolymerase [Simplicispira suum]